MTYSNQIVNHKIHKIENALSQGYLVNNRLQVVKKEGIKWAWVRFTQALVKLFSCCTGQIPWKDYQPDSVMAALKKLTRESPEAERKLKGLEDLLFKRKPNITPLEKPQIQIDPILPENAQEMMQTALANFANDLCREISLKNQGSYAISPLSILAAFGMFLHAIDKDHKALFLEKIGLKGVAESDAHAIISHTLKKMGFPADFKEGVLEIGNGIALKPGVIPAPSLMKLVKETYDAALIQSANLKEEVNKWVAEKTHDRIPTILEDNQANLVLLNAVYLAFQWKDKFQKPNQGWAVQDFTCLDGTKAPVSMMTQKEEFPIYESEHFDMLEKPYISPEGRKLSQLIFLPKDPSKLNDLEQDLTFDKIADYRSKAIEKEVWLSMPKIKAEASFELNSVLKALGIPFDKVNQNIVGDAGDLIKVLHKTFVMNDEKGSEAAAVTAICFAKCMRPQLSEFNINRPYAYFIMDGDAVLFRGRVVDKNPLVVDPQ